MADLDDPEVVAQARSAFLDVQSKAASLSPTTRRMVLASVAEHASAAEWDQLHAMAKASQTEVERYEFYVLLGQTADAGLASRALDLALSGEPAPTTAPSMIEAVARRHPGLALAFTIAHWDQIGPMLDPDSRAPVRAGSAVRRDRPRPAGGARRLRRQDHPA